MPPAVDFNSVSLLYLLVAAFGVVCAVMHLRAAANPVLLPKAKPRAMREHFVVSSIRSREVVRAQRSFVRHCEDALKALDFGNSLLGVHSVPISNMRGAIVKRSGICCRALRCGESVSMCSLAFHFGLRSANTNPSRYTSFPTSTDRLYPNIGPA